MHRIDGAGATVDHTFTEGDPIGGVQATVVTAPWLNDIQEELMSILTAGGVAPAKGTQNQVLSAFTTLIRGQGFSAYTTAGTSPAFTLTPSPAIAAYAANQRFRVKFNAAAINGTLNISGLGPKNLKQYDLSGAKVAAVISSQLADVEYDGTDWVVLNPLATDLTNAARIDVASAATVNLTSSAPGTRNIRITGTTAITAFTLAIGQTYFVSFAGVCTLTNNAAIVTNSGANIVTAPGDSCVIRAMAANAVEVLMYTPGIPQALGYRQTLQVPTLLLNTNYTNNTGRPWLLTVRVSTTGGSASGNRIGIQLDGGNQYYGAGTQGAGAGYSLCAVGVIPVGAVFRININDAVLTDCSGMTI